MPSDRSRHAPRDHLVVVVIGVVVHNVEELELVDPLASGDDAEPVAELELLEELLGPFRERQCLLEGRSAFGGAAYRYLR